MCPYCRAVIEQRFYDVYLKHRELLHDSARLENGTVVPVSRCYHCKKVLMVTAPTTCPPDVAKTILPVPLIEEQQQMLGRASTPHDQL